MEYERSDAKLRMVNPGHDLYVDCALFNVPDWMPPLSIEDNDAIHDSLLTALPNEILRAHPLEIAPDSIWPLVVTTWRRRLPLQGTDIWPMIAAHGVSDDKKTQLLSNFEFGLKVLTLANGRPPIKRKRMQPMSAGRYMTKARRNLYST
jgi:hypothetical protein